MKPVGACGLDDFAGRVAAAEPVPGGGCVAAFAGSLAAALGEMMAGLTEGKSKFSSVLPQVREVHAKLSGLRAELRILVEEDAAAFQSLLDARKLPKKPDENRSAREAAIEKATRAATRTPLRTAAAASEVLECLEVLARIGNPNVACDLGVGAQIACASLLGVQYNVLANISGIRDKAFAESCRLQISDLVRKGKGILQKIDQILSQAPKH